MLSCLIVAELDWSYQSNSLCGKLVQKFDLIQSKFGCYKIGS